MNPFIYPEFWLSLAFILILGMIISPSVRRYIQKFFKNYQQQIKENIQNASEVYREALKMRHQTLEEMKIKQADKTLKQEIRTLRKDFNEKRQIQILAQKQDFQVRQNLIADQMKAHLTSRLLDSAEEEILKCSTSPKSVRKEIEHFFKMLHKHENTLKAIRK